MLLICLILGRRNIFFENIQLIQFQFTRTNLQCHFETALNFGSNYNTLGFPKNFQIFKSTPFYSPLENKYMLPARASEKQTNKQTKLKNKKSVKFLFVKLRVNLDDLKYDIALRNKLYTLGLSSPRSSNPWWSIGIEYGVLSCPFLRSQSRH